jgi:MOSC domain-containing protein YiiM/ferredoxin-NADP reductase
MEPVDFAALDAPWQRDKLLQLRTSKMQPMHNLSITTGIYKLPRTERVFCSFTGFESDEHDPTFHGGVDKAVHQYYPGHYASWRSEFSLGQNFDIGGFGENLVSERMNERNVCIGDKVRVGGALLQVSLPRQPCFKLNHRFNLKAFSSQTWKKSRTGWYYRVLEEGWVQAGDDIVLVERLWPDWTIERVQEYLHRDKENREMLLQVREEALTSVWYINSLQLMKIDEFGAECKKGFKKLLQKLKEKQESQVAKKEPEKWEVFKLTEKTVQTERIKSFTFEKPGEGKKLDPGCFVRLKLPNGLIRPYSIVGGTTHRFQLGIALEDPSRGGSEYLHRMLHEGDTILVGKITGSVPIANQSSSHVFIAGGIGITAFLAHFDVYDQINFNYTLHYAVRSAEDIPFKEQIEKLGSKAIIYEKAKGERMDITSILKERTWNSQIYTCGPQRMIDEIVRVSNDIGMDQDEIHYEAFQISTSGDPFTVELAKSKDTFHVDGDKTLLETLRDAGLEVESSCETGNCGTCRIEVCEGKVEHRGSALSEEDKNVSMLSCVSRGIGHIVIDF